MTMLQLLLLVMLVFAAISLLSAVALARPRRRGRVGRWCPPAADPFIHPFGEMPELSADAFLSAELHRQSHAAGRATPAAAGGSGGVVLSDAAAVCRGGMPRKRGEHRNTHGARHAR